MSLYAVEIETEFVFEKEVSSIEEYGDLKVSLEKEGYHDFALI